ncbi:tandem five-TM protein [Staphylococcus aureus]|nr:tandem five-TM protein [Staphylococcus aureus]
MLCESKIINKNPKYRIIKYNDEYLMVDIISTWISLFFPFINWFIPKRYVKISREEFENLNIVKPAKKNVFWPVAGSSALLGVALRKYTHLLDIQLDKKLVIAICCITFIGILIFYVRLIKKSSLNIYNTKNKRSKIFLIPTLKNVCFTLFGYAFFILWTVIFSYALLSMSYQNIIVYFAWITAIMGFFLVNIALIIDKNIHVILKN